MTYGELFAGVSGMGLGFDVAGMICRWRVEIDRAAAGVLARNHPDTILEADVVAFAKWLSRLKKHDPERFERYLVDVLGGGSPCQDLSVAGLRKGLDGERSGLFRIMVRICRILRPRIVVWENVLGALSSNAGKDFACVIGAFTGCVPEVPDDGWGAGGFARAAEPGRWNVAWRVLDSQYFGVPQRRQRVFLVGSLGDGSCAEILFEPESVCGDPAPSRTAGERFAGTLTKSALDGSSPCGGDGREGGLVTGTLSARHGAGGGLGTDFECNGGLIAAEVAPTLNAAFGKKLGLENQHIDSGGGFSSPCIANPLTSRMAKGINTTCDEGQTLIPTRRGGFFDDAVTHTLTGNGFDASEDGTGSGTPLVAVQGDAYKCGSCSHFGHQARHGTTCPACGANYYENVMTAPKMGPNAGQIFDFAAQSWRPKSEVTPFDTTQITSAENRSRPQPCSPCHPLAAAAHPPAIAFSTRTRGDDGRGYEREVHINVEVSPTLDTVKPHAVAFNLRGRDGGAMAEPCEAASVRAASGGSSRSYVAFDCKASGQCGFGVGEVASTMRSMGHTNSHQNGGGHLAASTPTGVRRLTPRECERLQGWPDDHTRWRFKVSRMGNTWKIISREPVEQADGPRYKQAGNGITSTVARYIGIRIVKFSPISKSA